MCSKLFGGLRDESFNVDGWMEEKLERSFVEDVEILVMSREK